MIWLPTDVNPLIVIERFFSFFLYHYEEGYHFPGETHNFWECVYVLDGSICVSGDERIYHLTTGGIIFHKPMELHKFWVDTSAGATLLIFSFSLEGSMSQYLKDKVFLLSDCQQNIVSSMLDYIHDKLRHCSIPDYVSCHQRYLFPFKIVPAYSQMLTTYVYQLILSLIGDGTVFDVLTDPEAFLYNQAVRFMSSQITNQVSVSEIAAFCNTSESTLKRIFAKYSGISIHKYYIKLKIKNATELLTEGLSVTETAEKLGFSSQAYFSTVFKRETGINPSEFSSQV